MGAGMSGSGIRPALDAYVAYFEGLSRETAADLERLAAPDIRFKDPFNDFRDRTRLIRLFTHMFDKLDAPRFVVMDKAVGDRAAYLRWTFTFRVKGKADEWRIEGMSEVLFGADGLVTAHIDHWDAAEQFYEKLPVLGALVRLVKRRMAD